MTMRPPIPVLRVFDHAIARKFYVDWLGFRLDWEHRLDPTAPIYLQVSRDGALLHLSEHWGDCCPGAKVLIPVDRVDEFFSELARRPIPNYHPAVEEAAWGGRVMMLTDPFGNRLVFSQPTAQAEISSPGPPES